MKKIGVVLVLALAFGLITGCASSGGSSGGDISVEPLVVDVSQLGTIKNTVAFTRNYQDFDIELPDFPGVDFSLYNRVIIRVKYYGATGEELGQEDGNGMVSLMYDKDGDRGPEMGGPSKNAPLKELNLGGYSGSASKDRGARVTFKDGPPKWIKFQNCNTGVKFIELTEIQFFRS